LIGDPDTWTGAVLVKDTD